MVPASRRALLRTVGGCAATVATAPTVSAAEASAQLVFVYDDGPTNDYTQALPVHQEEDASACVGACPDLVRDPDEGLNREHLVEMQDAGWEIMSHSTAHRALGPIRLVDDVAPGDERIYVEFALHGEHPGDAIRLLGDEHSEVVTVTGIASDEETGCLTLDSPVEHAYSTENGATERLSDDVLEAAIAGSKADLEAMGLAIDNFVFPYGRYGARTMEFVRGHYVGVANYDWQGLNPGQGVDPYAVGREYFREEVMTRAEIRSFLDRVAAEDGLGMFAGHTWKEDLTPERIRFAIREAKERDVEVVTLREAFESQGVVDTTTPTPSPSPTPSSTPTPTRSTTATGSPTVTGTSAGSDSSSSLFDLFFDALFDWLDGLF